MSFEVGYRSDLDQGCVKVTAAAHFKNLNSCIRNSKLKDFYGFATVRSFGYFSQYLKRKVLLP